VMGASFAMVQRRCFGNIMRSAWKISCSQLLDLSGETAITSEPAATRMAITAMVLA